MSEQGRVSALPPGLRGARCAGRCASIPGGRAERAEAIRIDVLRLAPVPWTVLDRAGLEAPAARALAPGTVARKARNQRFGFAQLHAGTGLAEETGLVRSMSVDTRSQAAGRWGETSFARERKEWGRRIQGVARAGRRVRGGPPHASA